MCIWALHFQAMHEMMPYFGASGHNWYSKCINVYLQQMHTLHETHPEVSRHFDQRQLYNLQCLAKLPWLTMTRICLRFCVFMSRKILVEVFFKPEVRSGTKKNPRCWNIKHVQRVLGRAVGNNILFAHAILGCDTTSRVFSMGKGFALKHSRSVEHFITQTEVFLQENATLADISSTMRNSTSMPVHRCSG